MFSSRTPLEGVLINNACMQYRSQQHSSAKLQEGDITRLLEGKWVNNPCSSKHYFVFKCHRNTVFAYRVELSLPPSVSIHCDIVDTLLVKHSDGIDIISSQLLWECQVRSGDCDLSYLVHGSCIYLFTHVTTHASEDCSQAITFNMFTNAINVKDVDYAQGTAIEFRTRITRVYPCVDPKTGRVLALVQQRGEEVFLSLSELNLNLMQVVGYVEKFVLRAQPYHLAATVLGDCILIVTMLGVSLAYFEGGVRTIRFSKEDGLMFNKLYTSYYNRVFRLVPVGVDSSTAILISHAKLLSIDTKALTINPLYTQNFTSGSLDIFQDREYNWFKLKRSTFDLDKLFVYSGAKLYEVDLSFLSVVVNSPDSRISSINRGFHVNSLSDKYFHDCYLESNESMIPAHKFIISNRVPKLLDGLDSNNVIKLTELTLSEVNTLKEFVYTGAIAQGTSWIQADKVRALVMEHFEAEDRFWSKALNTHERQEQQQYTDIEFYFSKADRTVVSHGILWQSVSQLFSDLADTCENEATSDGVKSRFVIDEMFENITDPVFNFVLNWVYTREANLPSLTPDQILDVIQIAGLFGLELLLYQCENYLVTRFAEFNLRTCMFVLDLAKRFALRKLYNMSFDTIAEKCKFAPLGMKKLLKSTVGDAVAEEFFIISGELAYLRNFHNCKLSAHHYYQLPFEFIDSAERQSAVPTNALVNVPLTNSNLLLFGDACEHSPHVQVVSEQMSAKGAVWLKERLVWNNSFTVTFTFERQRDSSRLAVVLIRSGYHLDLLNPSGQWLNFSGNDHQKDYYAFEILRDQTATFKLSCTDKTLSLATSNIGRVNVQHKDATGYILGCIAIRGNSSGHPIILKELTYTTD